MIETTKKREGYAVELFFDLETEYRLSVFREAMYQQTGITPVLGKMNDRPHVSLAVFGSIEPEPLIQVTEGFFADVVKFPVELSAVGTFPTSDNVVFLTPVPNITLIDLHQRFHKVLHENNLRANKYYLPGKWVPHCTVEFELPDGELDVSLSYLRKKFTPVQGVFTRIGIVGFQPVEYIADYLLKG